MTPDLAEELAGARRVFIDKMPASAGWLFGAGLTQPLPACTRTTVFQRVGVGGIVLGEQDRYAPAARDDQTRAELWSDGALAIIVPVLDRCESLVDLVAIRRDKAGGFQWWRRTGAIAVLGEPYCAWCAHFDQPIRLLPDPASWLACRGDGAVILDFNLEAELLIRAVDELVIDPADKPFATFVYNWLRRPQKRHHPEIRLRASGEGAAA